MPRVDHGYDDVPTCAAESMGAGSSQHDGYFVGDEQIAVGGRVDGSERRECGLEKLRGPRDRYALG
jgi:hypothetical protein